MKMSVRLPGRAQFCPVWPNRCDFSRGLSIIDRPDLLDRWRMPRRRRCHWPSRNSDFSPIYYVRARKQTHRLSNFRGGVSVSSKRVLLPAPSDSHYTYRVHLGRWVERWSEKNENKSEQKRNRKKDDNSASGLVSLNLCVPIGLW